MPWSAYIATGWLRSGGQNPVSLASDIGTELLAEVRWHMAEMLTLDAGGSWLVTGHLDKNRSTAPSPDDLYQLYARWQLEFYGAGGRSQKGHPHETLSC